MSDSHKDDDGVIGYQVTTVTPANMAPMAAAALPSMMILPAVAFIRSMRHRFCAGRFCCAYSRPLSTACTFGSIAFFLRAIQPSLLARMVNQVGRPAMLEGNMFFPLTGTPIWKIERIRTLFDDCDPDPLTVATWMVQSLTMGRAATWGSSSTAVAVVESDTVVPPWGKGGIFY